MDSPDHSPDPQPSAESFDPIPVAANIARNYLDDPFSHSGSGPYAPGEAPAGDLYDKPHEVVQLAERDQQVVALETRHQEDQGEKKELVDENDRLHDIAYTDPITKLPNRPAFNEELNSRIKQGSVVALGYVDANKFKLVNDTYGHDHGDRTLFGMARRLEQGVRGDDYVARIGGDEFAIIFNKQGRSEEGVPLEQQLQGIEETLKTALKEFAVITALDALDFGGAVGVVAYKEGMDATALMQAADTAMYKDKAAQEAARLAKATQS